MNAATTVICVNDVFMNLVTHLIQWFPTFLGLQHLQKRNIICGN